MKFAISAALLSLAGLVAARDSLNVPRQSCPQATRFGVLSVTPNDVPLNPGDEFVVHVDLNCAVNSFGIVPKFLDYSIIVPAPANNGHEPPMVIARRTLPAGTTSDTFTSTVPHGYYFQGANYFVQFVNTYPTKGTDGSEVLLQGSVSTGININTAA
ncbi:hypothetical protein FPV67DRAFT_1623358 [Lyophyllum atratum]|nr:hypothetical protein FPV67DRAFT_1623358 [Lyophyllum atratum]